MRTLFTSLLLLSLTAFSAHADEAPKATGMTIAQDKDGNVVIELSGPRHSVRVDVVDNDRPEIELKVTVYTGATGPILSTMITEPKSLTIKGFVITGRQWQLFEDRSYVQDQFGTKYSIENGEVLKEKPKSNAMQGTLTWTQEGRRQYTFLFSEADSKRVWRYDSHPQ